MINKDFENYTKYKSGKWDLFIERLQETLESGQKVVVFSLPGAFTPTCSSTHAPGYEAKFEEFKNLV
jgi:peroxiredoxin